MAAFSYHLDSNIFLPNIAPTIIMDDGNFNSNCFSQFYSPELFEEPVLEQPNCHESSCVDHCSNSKDVVSQNDNEPWLGKKQSTGCGDSAVVVDKLEDGEQVTQSLTLGNRKRRTRNGRTLNSAKPKEKKKCNNGKKIEKKSAEEPPKGYIHVRARRGQATDSHSLAERVRRKKISERMKILQCLVPGCEKVTGKALMLDEIINYVQSLQNQVEFLSMKLSSVNPMFYDFGVDLEGLMVKPEREKTEASTTCLQEKSINPTEASAFVDSTTATFAPSHNYHLPQFFSPSPALLLHHGQNPIVFSQPQDNGSIFWDVEDQRQKNLNPSGLNDNLCSFH